MSDKPTVAAALSAVMEAVQSISKDQAVTSGPARFNFRGVDDVMQAVGPALRAHGVIFAPSRVVSVEHERYETAKGSPMDGVTVVVEYTITGPAGDTMTAAAAGQAADSGDKAVPKAMSVAFRTVLLQALCIPTGDPDPDSSVHERGSTAAPDPRQEWWDRIIGLGASGGHTAGSIRKHYAEKQGHEIDGPESNALTLEQYHDKLAAHFEEQAAKRANGGEATPVPADDPWQTPAPVGAS